MAYAYSELLIQAQLWAQNAVAAGFLSGEQAQALADLDQRSPEQLFSQSTIQAGRPLIVAFMGGTGVGKSSLLNRLAGQAIAKAGVERPTSREVTLYHHHSIALQQLPEALPLSSIKISQHYEDSNRQLVWIDMPDFDSLELSNQRLVLQWLPHIDVLLYVVSPERYRDNKAWQLLLAEGAKHAWLFVMNQSDRGLAVQYDDFKQQLSKAGFNHPLIFRTSCTEPEGDEFAELLAQLQQLLSNHSVEQLQQRNQNLRLQQLAQVLQLWQQSLMTQNFSQLQQQFLSSWPKQMQALQQGLAWPIQQLAGSWANQLAANSDIKLWDDWAQTRLDDVLDELILQASQIGIASSSIKLAVQPIRQLAGKVLVQQAEVSGRQAMLKPGNGFQRGLIVVTQWAETLLPITAMAIVGYQVFAGYYHSAADASAYLGVDFAVHSSLLIGLSWLIPYFVHKKIQPSLQKAAINGLQKGVQQALLAIEVEVSQVLTQQQQQLLIELKKLAELIAACGPQTPVFAGNQSVLTRVLPEI